MKMAVMTIGAPQCWQMNVGGAPISHLLYFQIQR
jgi:hypothetical protein